MKSGSMKWHEKKTLLRDLSGVCNPLSLRDVRRENCEQRVFDPEFDPENYDVCFRFYKEKLIVKESNKILHYWPDRISRTWEEYKDNRYFDFKLQYFYPLDREKSRSFVLWRSGRNGKGLIKKTNFIRGATMSEKSEKRFTELKRNIMKVSPLWKIFNY